MYNEKYNEIVIGGKIPNVISTSYKSVKGLADEQLSVNYELYRANIPELTITFYLFKSSKEGSILTEFIANNDGAGVQKYLFSLAMTHAPDVIYKQITQAVKTAKHEGKREAKAEFKKWLNS